MIRSAPAPRLRWLVLLQFGLIFILLSLIIFPARSAFANSIAINSTGDAADSNTGDGVCATSGGVCTLRAAIQTSNATGNQFFTFDPTVFATAKTITLGSELPAITGQLEIDGPSLHTVTIDGANNFRIFIVANGGFFTVNWLTLTHSGGASFGGAINNAGTIIVNNITFKNNAASQGAGVYNVGTATITNSTFSANTASTSGGGLFNGGSGNLTVENDTLSANAAPAGHGGGLDNALGTSTVYNSIITASTTGSDCIQGGGTVTVQSSLVKDGSCSVVSGTNGNLTGNPKIGALTGSPGYFPLQTGSPAIDAGDNTLMTQLITPDAAGNIRVYGKVDMGSFEVDPACPTFPYTVPAGNVTSLGYAIACANITPGNQTINLTSGSTYTLTTVSDTYSDGVGLPPITNAVIAGSLTIVGNGATIQRSSAGGIPDFRLFYVGDGGNLTLTTMTVNNGVLNGLFFGAGVLSNGTLAVSYSTFTGNTAYNGGAIFNFGTLSVTGSTFSSNSASGALGGGSSVATSSPSAVATISNSTLFDAGSTIFNFGAQLTVTNTTIKGTIQMDEGTLTLGSSIVNYIFGTVNSLGYNVIVMTDGNTTINGNTASNLINGAASPLNLQGLTNNGGLNFTEALGAGSVAIGHGSCATLSGIPAVLFDQRGATRKSPCDVGAYETNLYTPTTKLDRIGLYNPTNALWLQRDHLTTGSDSDASFLYGGISGGLAFGGDWNNDGVDSPGMYVPSTAYWFFRNSNDTGIGDITAVFGGIPGALPIVGDWNGDGVDTMGLYVPSTGQWLLKNSNSTGTGNPDISFIFGPISGAVPIVGDWDGNGFDTVGLYVPSTGLWVEHSTVASVGTDTTFVFGGISGGLPLVGDWNGDGVDTPGMYVPSTAYWFFRNSNSTGLGDITMVYGGIAGALPVVGHWSNGITPSRPQVEPRQQNNVLPTEEVTAEATDSRQRNTQFTAEATTEVTDQATEASTVEATEPVVVPTALPTDLPTALAFPTLPVNPPGDTTLPTQVVSEEVTPESTVEALPTALPFPTLPPPASPTDLPTAQSFPTLPSPSTPTALPTLAPVSPPVSDPLDDGAPNWAHTSGWTLAPHGSGFAWVMTSASTSETLLWQTTIDLTAQPNVSLSFASFFAGNGLASVQISTDNGANWTAIAAVSPSSDWSTITVDLSSYTGNIIQIEFIWQATDTTVNQWGIDDVSVAVLSEVQGTPTDAPTATAITTEAAAPTALATDAVTNTDEAAAS